MNRLLECQRSGDLLSEPAAHLLPQPSSNSAPALLSCACRRSASSFASRDLEAWMVTWAHTTPKKKEAGRE